MRFDFVRSRPTRHLVRGATLAGVLVAGLHGPVAYAGRPMVTDDAGLVAARSCQIEAWVQLHRDSTDYWALPACNLGGNLEITLGGALTRAAGHTQTRAQVLQAKTLFKPLPVNGWGIGLAAGTLRDAQAERDAHDWYAYVPASLSLRDDAVLLHGNLGWLRSGQDRRHRLTWGVGAEARATERSAWFIETYGEDRGRPFYHLGLRHELVPGRLQIDASYGNRHGGGSAERWFSVGLVWVSPPFLP